MAVSILTEDLLRLCLVAADGDLNTPLGRVVRRLERFQRHNRRRFGVCQGDLRSAFRMLVMENRNLLDLYDVEFSQLFDAFDRIPLQQTVLLLLKYADLYCNDEGEHWCITRPRYERPRSTADRALRRFFLDPRNHRTRRVREMMTTRRLDEAVLMRVSRSGSI